MNINGRRMIWNRCVSEPVHLVSPTASGHVDSLDSLPQVSSDFYKGFSSLDSLPQAGNVKDTSAIVDLSVTQLVRARVSTSGHRGIKKRKRGFKRIVTEPTILSLQEKANVLNIPAGASSPHVGIGSDVASSIEDLLVTQLHFGRSLTAPCFYDSMFDCNAFQRFVTEPVRPLIENNNVYNMGGSAPATLSTLSTLPTHGQSILDEFEAWVDEAEDAEFEAWLQEALENERNEIRPHQHEHFGGELDERSASSSSTCSTRDNSSGQTLDESVSRPSGESTDSDGIHEQASGLMLSRTRQSPHVSFMESFIQRRLASFDTASKLTRYLWQPGVIALGAICIFVLARKNKQALKG